MKNTTKILFILVSCLLSLVAVQAAQAAGEISTSPVIIDEKGYARDIITRTIKVKNNASHRFTVYLNVNDVKAEDGTQEFERAYGTDQAETLANWTQIKRSVDLMPGEEQELELKFHVNLHAKPGTYHAQISFYSGPTRDKAEASGPLSQILVNFEVLDDVKENMQLVSFNPEKTFFSGFPVAFDYEIENIGNRELSPGGEIVIYNRRGKEVASVNIAGTGTVAPDASESYAVKWQKQAGVNTGLASIGSGVGSFGKYKAVIRMNYGIKNPASVQDTIFFWIIPWHLLLGLFTMLTFAVVFGVNRFHKRVYE